MTDREILQGIDKLEDGIPFDEIRNGDGWLDIHELLSEIRERIGAWHYPSKGEYPTDGEETLIIFKHRGEKVFKVDKYSKQYNGWQFSPKPIAWMPLPEPPQEEV